MASDDAALHVLHRPGKSGLGRAYTAGFAHALAQRRGLRGRDGRRPLPRPRRPPAADRARGGRRRPRARLALHAGGGIENWGLDRRVLSRLGCGYARRTLGVPVRDLTGGFKCFRAERAAGDRRPRRPRPRATPSRWSSPTACSRSASPSSRCRSASASAGSASPRCPPASRSRRRGGSGPALRAAAMASAPGGRAHLPMLYRVKSDQLALVQGWPHTRATLRRWNAAPWRLFAAWSLGSLLRDGAAAGRDLVRGRQRAPGPDPAQLPGPDPPGDDARTSSSSCAATSPCWRCMRWRAWRASWPAGSAAASR